jgi:hypothetical protein
MKFGGKLLQAAEKYTAGVDKVLQSNAVVTALGAVAASSGVPGIDKVLKGVEKLIPDGGIKFTKLKDALNTGNRTNGQKSISPVAADVMPINTEPTFDWKNWSTYPNWAKYTIIGIVPAGLLIYALLGSKKKKRY